MFLLLSSPTYLCDSNFFLFIICYASQHISAATAGVASAPRAYDPNAPKGPVLFNIAEMKRLTAERLKLQRLRIAKPDKGREETHLAAVKKTSRKTVVNEVSIPHAGCTLRELASRMSLKLVDVKNKLLELGEKVDAVDPSTQPVHVKGKQKRGMRARLAQAKGTEGDSFIEADVAELVVLEMGQVAKR